MKTKIYSFLTLVLLVFSANIYSQSVSKLYIPTVESGLGKEISVPIYLTNDAAIVAAQFKLHFPEGSVVNQTSVALSDRKVDHSISVKSLGNNDYLFVVFSAKNAELRGNSGILLRVTVKIPETWTVNSTYPFAFNQVILSLLNGANVATVSDPGLIKVVAEPRPDVTVQNISMSQQNVSPLGKLNIAWQVKNIGDKITGAGWSEQVSLINEIGEQVLLGTINYDQLLDAGSIVSRQAEFIIPEYPGMDGNAKVQVKIIPNSTLGELITAQSNNVGLSGGTINIDKRLNLTIAAKSIQENNPALIICRLFRSGSRAIDQTFSLRTDSPNRLKIPESVTIKAGQSGAVFYFNSIDNKVLNLDSTVIIYAKGIGYSEVSDSLTIIDDEIPSLKITSSKNELNEGDTFTLTIEREIVTNSALKVNLSTDYSKRFNLPTEVIIPSNEKSVIINASVVDDAIPALTVNPVFTASAFGYSKATCTVSLADNDVPVISLSIAPGTVAESAGYQAAVGVVHRQGSTDNVITIKLSDDSNGGIYYSNPMITLEKGVSEKQFTVGVVDNALVDGNRDIAITAAVYISTCGCSASGTGAGVVQSKLTILDDDGPSLKISSSQTMLPEGKSKATSLTISRNTATNQSLTLTLSSDRDADLTYQQTVIIPAGSTSITIPVDVINNNTSEGDRTVTFTASADGFTKGVCWAMITDQTLADAIVNILYVTPTSPLAKGTIQSEVLVTNSGVATLAAHTTVDVYLCNTTSLSSSSTKQLLTTLYTSKDIAPQGNESLTAALILPDLTGQYYAIAQVDVAQTQKELSYLNNVSEAQSLKLIPSYAVNVTTDKNSYKPGEVVVLSGKAFAQGSSTVSGVAVDVYVINNGYRQSLKATTDATGAFQVNFTPYSGQMGHFVAGACYPNEALTTEQVAFDIYGLKRTSNDNIIWDVLVNEQNTGEIEITNPGTLPLTGLKTTIISNPATGVQLSLDALNDLAAGGTAKLKYNLTGSTVSTSSQYDQLKFQVTSNEGANLDITAYYYCRSPKATLKASLPSIQTTMTKGATRTYQFTITNNGKGASGKIKVLIPTTSWLSLVTPAEMPSLSYGESASVVMQLAPTNDMVAHTFENSLINIICEDGSSLSLPFSIETVSEKYGTLTVDVCDEYTYYTSQAPHLTGANVVVKHPYTGQIFYQGTTDVNGLFSVDYLPEGYYTIVVTADKHDSYQNNILVDPGKTVKTTVNLSFQAIVVTYKMVETSIPDVYTTETVVKYETSVPTPIIEMIAPDKIETDNLQQGESIIYNIILTNRGLITAKDIIVNVPEVFKTLKFEPLIGNGFYIKPLESVIVPVKVTKITPMQSSINKGRMNITTEDPCYDYNKIIYFWDCGLDRKWHEYPQTIKVRTCPTSTNSGGTNVSTNIIQVGPYTSPIPIPNPINNPIINYVIPNTYTTTPNVVNTEDCEPCQNSFTYKMAKCFVKQIPIVKKVLEMVETLQCVQKVVKNGDLVCLMDYVEKPEWVEKIIGYKDLYEDCIVPLIEPCVPGDFGFNAVKSQRVSLVNNMPSYIQHFQEVLKNTRIVSNSAEEQTLQIFGDISWVNITGGELSLFWNELTKKDGVVNVNDLELKKTKPSSISDAQYQKFIERWNNTLLNNKVDNFIDFDIINQKQNDVSGAKDYSKKLGYSSVSEMFEKEYEIYQKKADEARGSVCASISLQFSQTMTMTRQAFQGTLSVYNGHETASMQNVQLNLVVKDSEGNIVIQNNGGAIGNQMFQINAPTLDKLTAIDGTGILNAKETGTANIMFIPTKYAAPTISKVYTFGGTLSYLDPFTGLVVTRNLYPITMTVKPSPDLKLTYFMQRDVLGDDPLTPEVEPSEPAEFSLLINNVGAGDATNVHFSTAQPQIIQNEKGLLNEFKLIGSSLNGLPFTSSLSETTENDFGTISAGKTTYGQWWFTSNLLGHFTEYNTTVTHVTSYGNPNLSLVSDVSVHELIRSLNVPTNSGSRLTGFLANDIPDSDDAPDMLYLSDGNVEEVNTISEAVSTKTSDITYSLKVTPSKAGWNYGVINDPGNDHLKLISVIRQRDNASISLLNFWQTNRTLRDGKDPLYENRIHFADNFASGDETYVLTFEPKPDKVLAVEAISGVPESFSTSPVTKVTVRFNKPIDASTFTLDDITLKCQSAAVDISKLKIVTVSPTDYTFDLSSVTGNEGYYLLTVQTSNITDLEGYQGENGKQAGWTEHMSGDVQLTLKVIPENSGKVTPGTGGFTYGQSVALQATSEYGYDFSKWR